MSIKFYYNGIKTSDCEKIQGAYYMEQENGSISVNASRYIGFSPSVLEAFKVRNNSDSMTDYFEKDRFTVFPGDKYFSEILVAMLKDRVHTFRTKAKHLSKKATKYPENHPWNVEFNKMAVEAEEKAASFENRIKAA